MNKMNSVWEKSGALFLLYSQKGNVIMFLGLRNAPTALKVGSVQDCGKVCRAATKKRAAGHEPDGRRNIL